MDPHAPERPVGASAVRYLATAGAATAGYLVLLKLMLAIGLPYMAAILTAQAITIPAAFIAYRALVFGPGGTLRADFLRFVSVWITGAVAGLLTTPVLVEVAAMDPWVAQLLTIAVVAVASFIAHLRFTFDIREH